MSEFRDPVSGKLATALAEKWVYNPAQPRGYGGRFGSGGGPSTTPPQQPARQIGPAVYSSGPPPPPPKRPGKPPPKGGKPQNSQPGGNETTPGEKKVGQLLSQAQNLEKEAGAINKQIASLRKERKSLLAQAKAANSSSSGANVQNTSTAGGSTTQTAAGQANTTGTAAGSTSNTSAAQSTSSAAASYEAKAKAIGKQITALQAKSSSLMKQAKQLRAQAAQVKHVVPDLVKGAPVAETLDQAEAHVSFPIYKTETNADGDLIVYGKATDGTVDSDNQIVDSGWSQEALKNWLASGGNLRVQHNPHRDPAGVGLQIDADRDGDGSHYLKALVVEPTAKKLVSKGALRAFSVGIMRPKIVTDMKAAGGRIVGGELGEVSLVDRPANRNCSFTLVKADKTGNAEWIGKLTGDPDYLNKMLTPSPSDVARMVNKRSVEAPPVMPDVEQGSIWSDPVANRLQRALNAEKRVTASGRVVDSSGQDRSNVAGSDFAGPGKTFPIENQDDVPDAASLAHHAADPGAVRSRIRSIAQRKWPGMKMPPSLASKGELDGLTPELIKQYDAGVLTLDEALNKAGQKACPNCGKNYHADSDMSTCENCGHKLPAMKGDGECSTCGGTGKIREGHMKCPDCNGMFGKGVSNFGDKKAPPFGADGKPKDDGDSDSGGSDSQDDDSDDGDTNGDDDRPEENGIKQYKMVCPDCSTKIKKGAAFCYGCGAKIAKHVIPHSHPTPSDNAKAKDSKPVPAHREPDGPQTENFEEDAGMQDGDNHGKQPEPSPTWGKSADPADGVKNKPATDRGPGEDDEKQREEADYMVGHKMRSTTAPYVLMRAHDALCAAYDGSAVLAEYPSLKSFADAVDADEWRAAAREVVDSGNLDDAQKALAVASAAEALKRMDPAAVIDGRADLYKNFTSMYPTVKLSPGSITASQFQRPYISAGHSPLSAQKPGPQPDGPHPPPSPQASQFNRGPLTAGHESPSPGNSGGPRMKIMTGKGDAGIAMTVIHDHIADVWPDLCPMGAEHAAPKNLTSSDASGIADQLHRHAQTQYDGPDTVTKTVEPVMIAKTRKDDDTYILLAALREEMAEMRSAYQAQSQSLVKQVGDLQDVVNKQAAELDQLGSQPDPWASAYRSGTTAYPDVSSGAVPAERRSVVDEASDEMRASKLQFLKSLAVSGDPVIREGAERQIEKLLMAP